MQRREILRARIFLVLTMTLTAPAVTGCAFVDNFQPRANAYNEEASETKSSDIMRNIVRSAYTEPLQFTDISNVVGLGTYNAKSGSNIPVAVIPSTVSRTFSVSPEMAVSGQAQFTVMNQNNQEFYYGLHSPVSMQLIASYFQAGFDPRILLPLVVSSIEVEVDGRRSILFNDASNEEAFSAFYQSMSFLIDYGLSAEKVSAPPTVGPKLNETEAKHPKILSALLTSTSADPLTLKKDTAKNGESDKPTYHLAKGSGGYRFCFDPLLTPKARKARLTHNPNINFSSLRTDDTAALEIPLGKSNGVPIEGLVIKIPPKFFCGKGDAGTGADGNQDFGQLKVRTRSVAGIFQFLGQMVRTELGLSRTPASLEVRKDGYKFSIFRLTNVWNEGDLSIRHNGMIFSLQVDPSGAHDGSSRVLVLLTELIALQSSAKNFPAPTPIAIVDR